MKMKGYSVGFFPIVLIAVFVLISIILPIGCKSSSSPNTVNIVSSSYDPPSISVTLGTTVTWKNKANITHDVVSDTGIFNSGFIDPGGSYSFTFSTAGTYHYHCTLHPGMTGTVNVQ
jgi:plastocyanin